MDELTLLKDFRVEDAAADGAREHARAALRAAMTRRRRPRGYVIAIAFVAAALLAAGAYAIVHEFVVGAAAPADVNAQLKFDVGHFFDSELIPWRGHPRKTAGPTRVAAAAQTPQGPVYLLLTPLQGGGECLFIYTGREDGPPPNSTCNFGKPVHPNRFVYSTQNITAAGLMIVGYAPGAVHVRYAGASFKTPFGWFVVRSHVDKVLVAYGVHGGRVAGVTLGEASRTKETPQPTRPPADPAGPQRVVISTYTGWARTGLTYRPQGPPAYKWRQTHQPLKLAVAPDTTGGWCIHIRVGPHLLDQGLGCGYPRPRVDELHVVPVPLGWSARRTFMSTLVLFGEAGANIARVDVQFSDGRIAPATLREGMVFYVVRRPEFRAGHRPVEVVGRDARGYIVARKRLPFVR
jgi:hypothetical protein